MNVARSSRAGPGLSVATSDRAGIWSGSVTWSRAPAATRRSRIGGSWAPASPRLTAMKASIRRSPSKASRAYRTSPSNKEARSCST